MEQRLGLKKSVAQVLRDGLPLRDAALRLRHVGRVVEAHCAHDLLGDGVRVAVGGRAAILEITAALRRALSRDSNRRAAIRDARLELVVTSCLVQTCQQER